MNDVLEILTCSQLREKAMQPKKHMCIFVVDPFGTCLYKKMVWQDVPPPLAHQRLALINLGTLEVTLGTNVCSHEGGRSRSR